MKKKFNLKYLLLSLTFVLSGCSKINLKELYTVNKLLDQDLSKLEIYISTSNNELSLESSFIIDSKDSETYTVTYSIEKYSELSLEEENPATYKKLIAGQKDIAKGNTITELYDNYNISISNLSLSKFKIVALNYVDFKTENNIFEGKLKKAKEILGIDIDSCDVKIAYQDSFIEYVELSYAKDRFDNLIKFIPTK